MRTDLIRKRLPAALALAAMAVAWRTGLVAEGTIPGIPDQPIRVAPLERAEPARGDGLLSEKDRDGECDLAVTKSHGEGAAYAGGTATYSISVVVVSGPCAGTLTIVDHLPPGVAPVSSSYTYSVGPPGSVYWQVTGGPWQAGVSGTIELTVDLPPGFEGDAVENCVEISLRVPHGGSSHAPSRDTNPENDRACDCMAVEPCLDIMDDPALWDHLVGWWAGDGDPSDSSSAGNHGAEIGQVLYASSTPPQVLEDVEAFDFGSGGPFVEAPDDPTLDFAAQESFTIDAWVYPLAASGFDPIVVKKEDSGLKAPGSAYVGYQFFLENGMLKLGLGDGDAEVDFTGPQVPTNTWTNVAVTVKRTNSGNTVLFYVNAGSPVAGTSQGGGVAPAGSLENSSVLRIGHGVGSSTASFGGLVDEVEIFRTVLSQGQIALIMAPGKCRRDCEASFDFTTGLDATGTSLVTFPTTQELFDPQWTIVHSDWANDPGTPRPATVIYVNPNAAWPGFLGNLDGEHGFRSWHYPIPDTHWLSIGTHDSYPNWPQLPMWWADNGFFHFRSCFCLGSWISAPDLHLEMWADDDVARVLVNSVEIYDNPQPDIEWPNHNVGSFDNLLGETLIIENDDVSLYHEGQNCLTVIVQNDSLNYTGLDVSGGLEIDTCDCGEQDTNLNISKDDIVESGDLTGFRITVDNSGPGTALSFVVDDVLPSSFVYENFSPVSDWDCHVIGEEYWPDTASWVPGALPPGTWSPAGKLECTYKGAPLPPGGSATLEIWDSPASSIAGTVENCARVYSIYDTDDSDDEACVSWTSPGGSSGAG